MRIFDDYDVIVVGGGHAGCEAAHASAKMGCRTLLITQHLTLLAMMSCNPSVGGIGKGQIVREIDALGGMTGVVADKTMIQFRMLNKSKGPAMWSPRTQNDRRLYSFEWRKILENTQNLDFWQDTVVDIIVKDDEVKGVKTKLGLEIFSKSVVITTGTFLSGKIYIGKYCVEGGRIGESNSKGLTEALNEYGIKSGKLKTGTSIRIDGRTIDFSKMIEQKGDEEIQGFSFRNIKLPERQLSCYITYTNEEVHEILRKGFNDSPLFTGRIEGVGPRYCPSIEDKIVRFASKNSHQLFIEPEGWETVEYYINGFSSSLPLEIQVEAVHRIKGLENVKVLRPGYAIEYDYFPPTQLNYNLESRVIKNLFFAGQVNGTTGYEEAAAQGLIAGINAAAKCLGKKELILSRSESYIGVLIDDLVTKGVDEPYRMFTSRAENRLTLRQNNADFRLAKYGYEYGLISEELFKSTQEKYKVINDLIKEFKSYSVEPELINEYLEKNNSSKISQKMPLYNLVLRNEVKINELVKENYVIENILKKFNVDRAILEELEIQIKYSAYIEREKEIVERMQRLENITLHENFDYDKLLSISYEGREKLKKYKPRNIGQAARIPGVTPADINVLLVYLKR